MVVKNGKAPARRKSASSSAKSSRSNTVPKSGVHSQHVADTDQLDGNIDNNETTAVESEAGDRVLEETGIDGRASGDGVSTESVELTAITLHQSQLKVGDRVTDGTYFATVSIVSKADIYFDRDNGGSVCFPANELESFGWKLCDAWNPADFGETQHAIEPGGQLNSLEWDVEPPETDDYGSIELFDQAYKNWCDAQTDEAEEELANYGADELRDQLISKLSSEGFDKSVLSDSDAEDLIDFLLLNGEQECNTLADGSICAVESVLASPTQESNSGEEAPTTSASGTTTATQFSEEDIQIANANLATSEQLSLQSHNSAVEYNLLLLARLAPHSQLMESDSDLKTVETVSPTYLEQSETCSQNSPSSKTSEDCLTAPIHQATKPEPISGFSSTAYTRSGSMQNGKLSAAPTLPAPGVGNESLLLRSPGALSSSGKASPPGKTRLESQLHQFGLIQDGEVVNPEFLEAGYQLPIGFTNLAENRTALELAQQQSIAPKSESLPVMAITAIDVQPLATLSIGELPLSDSNELNISLILPSNIGALTKVELISAATEQHQLICVIERKEFDLALEKLHRVRLTGVYLQEFKKRCQYGEFENQLEQAGIGVRSAQQYMVIAKNWDIVEAKAKLVSLLTEESQPAIGLKWALETVRDEKKSLKSAAPPADPDCWRTPNTAAQPIVDLVKKALGGQIWCDPCADAGHRIPASIHYNRSDNGLAKYQTWSKTVFINPPFSDPFPWVEKCCLSIARGNVSAAVMLLKAGAVSNVGTGELINKYASAVCHWRGRINFLNDLGSPVKGSDFDCVLVYFGDRLDLFRQAFGSRGTISTIDNHYSSVNKKYQQPEIYTSVAAEERQMAAAVGLKNGRSLLPDMRDADRDLMERHDPSTVFENMPTVFTSIEQPKMSAEIESISAEFQQAKSDCLNDYITAISSNISAFSDEQIAFLAKIINEESARRIDF